MDFIKVVLEGGGVGMDCTVRVIKGVTLEDEDDDEVDRFLVLLDNEVVVEDEAEKSFCCLESDFNEVIPPRNVLSMRSLGFFPSSDATKLLSSLRNSSDNLVVICFDFFDFCFFVPTAATAEN